MSIGAAAVLVAGALAVGCSDSDDGSTIVLGGGTRTDNFPGTQVDAAFLADDLRAFSNSGQNVNPGSVRVFWNCETGTAIAMFTTTVTSGAGEQILYASYWNGSAFTKPVQLRLQDGNTNELPTGPILGYKVLFLNPVGNTDPDAAGRVGDAIILAVRADQAPAGSVTTTDEDSNNRLVAFYFDVSEVGNNTSGFDVTGQVLDNDNTFTTVTPDPAVTTFGFVSDSLCCSHEFTAGTDGVDSGEPTTQVAIVYLKEQGSGATAVGQRYKVIPFDLNQTGNAFPTTGGTELVPGAGAFGTGESAEAGFTVHNRVMFWRALALGTENDNTLTATVFPATGAVTAINAGSNLVGTSVDTTAQVAARHLYGDDHGLTSIYAFTTETGFGGNGAAGTRGSDADLMLIKMDIDQNTGAITTREIAEIDAFTGVVALDAGTDTDGFDPLPGDIGGVTQVDTRINRTGQYITALFLQPNTDSEDASETVNDANALDQNIVLRSVVVQTRRDATARTIAQSVAAVEASAQETSTGLVGGTGAQADVTAFQFQQDLATGHAFAQGGVCELGCVIQSNQNRMNWVYTQADNQQGGAAVAEDRLLLVDGVNVTLDTAAAPVAPTQANVAGTTKVVVARADTLEDAVVGGLTGANFINAGTLTDIVAVDAGDATTAGTPPVFTATAGRVLVYYAANGNNLDNLDAAGAFFERRLFVWDNGTTGTVSSDFTGTNVTDFGQFTNNTLQVITVPVNDNIVSSPNHGGSTQHVFWQEQITRGGNTQLATRTYVKARTTATPAVALVDRFNPPLSEGPVFIDNPTSGNLGGFAALRNQNTVGVYFIEDEHLWYQEITSDDPETGYIRTNGAVDAQLVDNESPEDFTIQTLSIRPECDNLNRSMVFWQKTEGGVGGGDQRLFVRVHN